jgi:hypothetical protein
MLFDDMRVPFAQITSRHDNLPSRNRVRPGVGYHQIGNIPPRFSVRTGYQIDRLANGVVGVVAWHDIQRLLLRINGHEERPGASHS